MRVYHSSASDEAVFYFINQSGEVIQAPCAQPKKARLVCPRLPLHPRSLHLANDRLFLFYDLPDLHFVEIPLSATPCVPQGFVFKHPLANKGPGYQARVTYHQASQVTLFYLYQGCHLYLIRRSADLSCVCHLYVYDDPIFNIDANDGRLLVQLDLGIEGTEVRLANENLSVAYRFPFCYTALLAFTGSLAFYLFSNAGLATALRVEYHLDQQQFLLCVMPMIEDRAVTHLHTNLHRNIRMAMENYSAPKYSCLDSILSQSS